MDKDTPTTAHKEAQCAGCGHYFPIRELAAIQEDDPGFLGVPFGYFEGDALCPRCYGRAA